MSGSVEDRRARLTEFGQGQDGEIDLAEAALLLASLDHPDPPLEACRAHLARMAAELAETSAGKGDQSLTARVGALHEVLAERHGFRRRHRNYDDLANANLIRVIERRRGLPVALGVIWLHAARGRRLGGAWRRLPRAFHDRRWKAAGRRR